MRRPHEDPACRCVGCVDFDTWRDMPETDLELELACEKNAAALPYEGALAWLPLMRDAETWSRELGQQVSEQLREFTRKLDGDDGWRPRDSTPTRPVC